MTNSSEKTRAYQDEYADRIHGLLLGCALGDSVGLPLEGRSRSWIGRNRPSQLRQGLILEKGMLSDDTEHSLMLAKTLIRFPNCTDSLELQFSFGLRWWLLGLPAGIGLATARSIIKLWLGFSPQKSGVHSAGNGAAMRSAIVGAFFSKDPEKISSFVRSATRITHTDERAYVGALAVAKVTAWFVEHPIGKRPEAWELRELLENSGQDQEWKGICRTIEKMAEENASVDRLASELGIEPAISGYVYHTVPMAIYASWRHVGRFREGIESVIRCGGDTDTVAAITGSLMGAESGTKELPREWTSNMIDWPRNKHYIKSIAKTLAEKTSSKNELRRLKLNPFAILARNIIFLILVIGHGLRRLLPPY